jgi:hypothetical protein
LDETETKASLVKQIVGMIAAIVGIVIVIVAPLLAEAWVASILLSIAFGVECLNLWALAGLIAMFNLSVYSKSSR